MLRSVFLVILMLIAAPASAVQSSGFAFGDDRFAAGNNVSHREEGIDDVFLAGNSVTLRAPVAGSAHVAGRFVTVSAPVADALYIAGVDLDIAAPIGGDVLAMGDKIDISAAITGDLRAMGSRVAINAAVAEAALLAGETVLIDAALAGDVSISAANIEFGNAATIAGVLHLYHSDPDSIEVPASVISADRIEFHPIEDWDGVTAGRNAAGWSFMTWLRGILGGILVVTLLATALAALAPDALARMRERGLESPLRTLWMGFLALSAAAGSLFLFAATGIGVLLVPVSILAALLLGFAGYVIGVYVLGVGVMGAAGRPNPETLLERATAALAGAFLITVLSFVPFVGWIVVLGIAVMGAGALIIRLFAPGFHTEVRG
ncbi:hypothetical protein [Aliiroseovarius subalbicans]|uniref:hypothetical protein n=1 Tax=Aliiroseovarius subalbicans TaxID=2925840 RepID=UPI001F59A84F|nr:hypothetical protein [Aliiroseovarius subalbicans]MCI2400634.1 hypothetical protein [Aliiroseovarius subalbicans]